MLAAVALLVGCDWGGLAGDAVQLCGHAGV